MFRPALKNVPSQLQALLAAKMGQHPLKILQVHLSHPCSLVKQSNLRLQTVNALWRSRSDVLQRMPHRVEVAEGPDLCFDFVQRKLESPGCVSGLPRPNAVNLATEHLFRLPSSEHDVVSNSQGIPKVPFCEVLLCGSLVPSSNHNIDVEMRSLLLADEQVERPAACNPPTKWSIRKQGLNVFGLERNDICSIGRLCVLRLHFAPALAAASGSMPWSASFAWNLAPSFVELRSWTSAGTAAFASVPNHPRTSVACSCTALDSSLRQHIRLGIAGFKK